MLTPTEIAILEEILVRERLAVGADRAALYDSITPGDIVQLRPGADPSWETSLLLVCQITQCGRVRGEILRPHRSGCREAWAEYSLPELARIGRTPFPEPAWEIRRALYSPAAERKPPGRAG